MSENARGIAAMIVACVIWGLSPILYAALAHVPALEVLAHRTFWGCVTFVIVLAVQGRLMHVPRALRVPSHFGVIALAACLISLNWGIFIWAVQAGRAIDASLGYYTFPLVAVCVGAVVFSDRLSRMQWVAVGLACVAVGVLTYGLGTAPWIALLLATSFAGYSTLKKRLSMGPVVSVAAEVTLLAPLALGYLIFWGSGGLQSSPLTAALLVLSGPLTTAAPLILFSYASRRVQMSTIGVVQYLNPTLQFLCAVIVLGEVFTGWHQIAFALIWTALGIYTISALRGGSRPAPPPPRPVP
jgi:chloramphenicol-sensitive protein RarD